METVEAIRDKPATATYAMSEAMAERVKEEAAKRDLSASKLVRDAIERHLVELAVEEAEKGVHIDRQRGRSESITARARPGWRAVQRQTVEMAKRLGVPLHDGATGRRIG